MLTNKNRMSKEELFILCCLKLKEKELYYLTKTVSSLNNLEAVTRLKFDKDDVENAKQLNKYMLGKGIKVCAFFEDKYPQVLKEIPFYPPFLFYIGEYREEDVNAISIVGSRKASFKGVQLTEQLVKGLASTSVTIVSGLASGIDTAAHKKALEEGLRTIAVLGCGVDVVYPAANRWLYKKIAEQGVIFSEHPPGTPPLAFHFPKRNRIISGLSKAVVVVEAGERSGSLITARYAMEHNKELFVFPRTPLEGNSEGNNNLIKLGAKLLTKPEDIILDLFPEHEIKRKETKPDLSLEEEKIYSHINEEPVNIDSLCFLLDMGPSTLANFLLILELKGLIKQLPGKFYVRA